MCLTKHPPRMGRGYLIRLEYRYYWIAVPFINANGNDRSGRIIAVRGHRLRSATLPRHLCLGNRDILGTIQLQYRWNLAIKIRALSAQIRAHNRNAVKKTAIPINYFLIQLYRKCYPIKYFLNPLRRLHYTLHLFLIPPTNYYLIQMRNQYLWEAWCYRFFIGLALWI